MLTFQLRRIFQFFDQNLLITYKDEIELVLQSIIYYYTTWQNRPTPGNQLMNVQFTDARPFTTTPLLAHDVDPHVPASASPLTAPLSLGQRLWLGLGGVGGRWLWAKINAHMRDLGWGHVPVGDWRRSAYRATRWSETAWRLGSVLNTAVFLYTGRYRSLLERIGRISMGLLRPRAVRHVSFEFMNQQLIWQGFAEFFFFLLPLFNLNKVQAWGRRLTNWLTGKQAAAAAEKGCPVCSADPISTPHESLPCRHVFCYYCLRASRLAEAPNPYSCPRCDTPITGQQPVTQQQQPTAATIAATTGPQART